MPTSESNDKSESNTSKTSEIKEEEDASSAGEYIDSPEPDVPSEENIPEEVNDVATSNLDGTMEGELDFEDEVADDDKSKLDCEQASSETHQANSCQLSSPDKKEVEEGEDEGEISDEDDLEEGEVKDGGSSPKQPGRQVCRFFNRGLCTWGNLCRFLHLSINEKGHYNMFPRTYPPMHRVRLPPLPPLPPPPPEVAPPESAWERGLRHAKELIEKASRRKEQEPDFEDKRLNLSIDENPRIMDYDKENDFGKVSYKRQSDVQAYKQYDDFNDYDNGDHEGGKEPWRGGRYENFEVKKWMRHKDMQGQKDRREDRRGGNRMSKKNMERDKMPKKVRGNERWRDDRLKFDMPPTRNRADEWKDPWQRSKSPRSGRRSHSRGRSGSYSSVSSNSYSDRSSRSSGSYTRSSSRSSFSSRRSTSSGSRTPSVSRSRSYSRTLSMDSVSSASSSASSSRNPHTSILRKDVEKVEPPKKTTSLFEEMQKLRQYSQRKAADKEVVAPKQPTPAPNLQYLLPTKQPIKLTLLNKALPSKTSVFPKEKKTEEAPKAVKRALSPEKNHIPPKKSTSSRRDELLKQLKAVEDAIARKRAKV